MQITTKLEGFEAAIRELDALPDKLQRNAILTMLRKSTQPMIRAARSKVSGYGAGYKELANSIGNITAKSRNAIIYVGPRVKGKWKYIGYYGHWVEYGTKGIKTSKSGTARTDNDKLFAPMVARVIKGGRYRADQPARPYMRPAIDQTKGAVQASVVDIFDKFLDKRVKQLVSRVK